MIFLFERKAKKKENWAFVFFFYSSAQLYDLDFQISVVFPVQNQCIPFLHTYH